MQRWAPVLNSFVVAAPDDLALVDNDRTDRDAALVPTGLGFVDRSLEKWVHAVILADYLAGRPHGIGRELHRARNRTRH